MRIVSAKFRPLKINRESSFDQILLHPESKLRQL